MELPAGSRLLVEGRFGRLTRDGKTLAPDTRKGLLRVLRTEDGLMHLMWMERDEGSGAKGEAEVDEIVFPEEAAFAQIPNQRAAALKFASEADRNMFFWIQEADASRDAALIAKVHAAINLPLGVDAEDVGMEEAGGDAPPRDALLRGALAASPGAGLTVPAGSSVGVLPQGPGQDPRLADSSPAAQLAAMLSGIASGAPAAGGGSGGQDAGSALGAALLSHHTSALCPPHSGIASGAPAPGGSGQDAGSALGAALLAALARQQHAQHMSGAAAGPSLADVLRPEAVAPLLADPEVLQRLGQYLPEEHRSVAELRQLARSAQFQQQLATFSGALQTGQLDLGQFGLRAEGYSVADFLRALEELVERERREAGGQAQE